MSRVLSAALTLACVWAQTDRTQTDQAQTDQAQTDQAKFEVASIRPTPPGERSSGTHSNDGGIRTHNTNVVQLIQTTYDVQDYQVTGGPGWVRSDGYDINAKFDPEAEKDLTAEQRNNLLRARGRNLLAERFHLKLREETKELPVYALTVAKGGHKLKVSAEKSGGMNTNRNNNTGKITAHARTLEDLTHTLGNILRRPVIDETGLGDGRFDFEINWTSDEGLAAADGSGPSIFTALQEQAGLKLESKKGPVRILVIEQVERPSEN